MPITIPNRNNVHPTTTPFRKPAQAKRGCRNQCPIRISLTGATGSGGPLAEPTNAREGYFGFNIRRDVPDGASADDEAYSAVSGVIVEGFAGVEPGRDVFIDPTARPALDAEGDFSGLTHTVPAGGIGERVGCGVTTTKIYFDMV
jgi:hypothetical protein